MRRHRRIYVLSLLVLAVQIVGWVYAESTPFSAPYGTNEPAFSIEPIPAAYRQGMNGLSWKADCPVSLDELRRVRIGYVGFDSRIMQGELVVHRAIAEEVSEIFRELLAAGYPIRSVSVVDRYQADDTASMNADNTSAFNYRPVAGSTSLSKHSYGIAIDINPVENPYIKGSTLSPQGGKLYADRTLVLPGMIIPGDPCHLAFIRRGWTWGGDWKTMKDYQHFEKPLAVEALK